MPVKNTSILTNGLPTFYDVISIVTVNYVLVRSMSLAVKDIDPKPVDIASDDHSVLIYTSGTTGLHFISINLSSSTVY
jgi:acyl-CoA synthetase (AMP-forming)/AMP-acid ligase II